MSGPKTSRYTLTPEQRRFMQDQLRLRSDRAALHNALAELSHCSSFIREHAERLAHADHQAIDAEAAAVRKLLAAAVPATPAELHALCRQTSRQLEQTLKVVSALTDRQKALRAQLDESIARDIARGFAATLDDALDAQAVTRAQYAERLRVILRDAVTAETAAQAQQALAQLRSLGDEGLLQSFATITVQPLERQHRQEAARYEAEKPQYMLLARQYAALCGQLGLPAEPVPWHPGAAAELAQRTAALEQQLCHQEEQAYIRQALDEVMLDMGYALIGERDVRKRSGARFHHALYTLGDGTAVDVTYDANGQIAMELGGLDDTDRLPDAMEAEALCTCMEDFCTSFEEVEARLAARGVVLRQRIALQPPDTAYAQIINVQDYPDAADAALFRPSEHVREQRRARQSMKEE